MIEILSNPTVGGDRVEVVEFPGLLDSDIVKASYVNEPAEEDAILDAVWTHSFDNSIPSGSLRCGFSKEASAGLVIKAIIERA